MRGVYATGNQTARYEHIEDEVSSYQMAMDDLQIRESGAGFQQQKLWAF